MPEKFPQFGPERPEEQPEKAPETIDNVVFTKVQKSDGSFEFRSSDPSRKIAFLDKGAGMESEEGKSYQVEIVRDTDPSDPAKGKFFVRIIGESGEAPTVERREIKREGPPLPIEQKGDKIYFLETELPVNQEEVDNVPKEENFRHFTLDERTLQLIEKIATAVELKEPCLLEGETSTSKTSAIQYAAMRTKNGVLRLNLNGQTDTSELIGKFVPNDGQLQIQFEEALRSPELLKPESKKILESVRKEQRTLNLVESQKLAQAEGFSIPEWRWQDGLDVVAKKKGMWLILDEINLAEAQILERLNSQLERNPSITLSENGSTVVREFTREEEELYKAGKLPGVEPLHPNFRIFATMNPAEYTGRMPMSPAYKDRWTSYKYAEPPGEKDYTAMMELMAYGEQPKVFVRGKEYRALKVEPLFKTLETIPNMRGFLAKMAKFHVKIEDMSKKREIGKSRKEPYTFTRRSLIEFLEYLETKSVVDRKTDRKLSVKEAPKDIILRAIQYYYLDKVSNADDRKKVKDQLDAIGISETKWLHKFEEAKANPALETKRGGEQNIFTLFSGEQVVADPRMKDMGGVGKVGDKLIRKPDVTLESLISAKEGVIVGFIYEVPKPLKAIIQFDGGKCILEQTSTLKERFDRVQEKKEETEKEFIGIDGEKIKVVSMLKESKGFRVGDRLKIREGFSGGVRDEVINAKEIVVVGFTPTGTIVKQLDGSRCVHDDFSHTKRFYEKVETKVE